MNRTITTILTTAALLAAPATAHADGCLVAGRTSIKIDTDNTLTTHVPGTLTGTSRRIIRIWIDTYHDGIREYHDEAAAYNAPGRIEGGSFEQLPLSWRSDRVVVRLRMATSCGVIVRQLAATTPANPLP